MWYAELNIINVSVSVYNYLRWNTPLLYGYLPHITLHPYESPCDIDKTQLVNLHMYAGDLLCKLLMAEFHDIFAIFKSGVCGPQAHACLVS